MTYETDCGGQKFYRNRFAKCGVSGGADGRDPGPRDCQCGTSQNSHLKLLNLFGEGTSLIPPPTVDITTPSASSTAANSLPNTVIAEAGSKRGVARVELYLNGYKWASAPGVPFGRAGQPNPGGYPLVIPNEVPDSIYDVKVVAYDDLEISGESETFTVTKGAAGGCATADTCLKGQKCEAGKCFWDPPAGEVGDACDFPQFCKTNQCSNSTIQGDGICTQTCVVGVADGCPSGLECVSTGGNGGLCYFPGDGGGCCSTSDSDVPWGALLFGSTVFGFVLLRKKRA
jgi:hypothetical protein